MDPVAFYRTVSSPGCEGIAADVLDGVYDVVVFSSPSTFLRLIEGDTHAPADVVAALAATRRVAIGTVTAAALADHGIPAHAVAIAPTEDGVLDAIREAL